MPDEKSKVYSEKVIHGEVPRCVLSVVKLCLFPSFHCLCLFLSSLPICSLPIFKPLDQMGNTCCKKKAFNQKLGSGINNSISCLVNSLSYFEKLSLSPWINVKHILLKSFFDQKLESWRNNYFSCLDNSISC